MDVRSHRIPGGGVGTATTLSAMIRLAVRASQMPAMREQAAALVRGVAPRDATGQALAISDWVGEHTVFLRDPAGAELLQAPELLLARIQATGMAQGDCDDVAMLAAALGRAIGLPTAYTVLAFHRPNAPWAHVYARVGPVEVDPTRPAQGLDALDVTRAMTVAF